MRVGGPLEVSPTRRTKDTRRRRRFEREIGGIDHITLDRDGYNTRHDNGQRMRERDGNIMHKSFGCLPLNVDKHFVCMQSARRGFEGSGIVRGDWCAMLDALMVPVAT